jgi:hypothetical protein
MTNYSPICTFFARFFGLFPVLTAARYNDDEPGQKAAAAPVAEQYSAVQPTSEIKQEFSGNAGPDQDYNGGDSHMNNDEYDDDDDDDIDFNLGDGPVTAVSHHEEKQVSYNAPPPPPHSKGPNAKEDG